ncbi:MAG TPA: hypothetical protein PLC14_10685, partial [Accumulibacter sp.]|uniref:hypothetical protein n=1 Tax=Accumulibacter sp. TaxID=2053492 RepID=UPI002C45D9C3
PSQIKNPHLSVVSFLKSWWYDHLAEPPCCRCSRAARGAHYTVVSGGVNTCFVKPAKTVCHFLRDPERPPPTARCRHNNLILKSFFVVFGSEGANYTGSKLGVNPFAKQFADH